MKSKDLTNHKFGKLLATDYAIHYTAGGNRLRVWHCICDCGNETFVSTHDLVSGHTKSCGECIYNVSPKVIYKRIFDAWRMMIARCENPKAKAYSNYGGRGIKVCAEWHNFDAFLSWSLNNGYTDILTIDRKDVDGNYEPSNCRWVTDKIQSNNKRNNHLVTYHGETHTVSEWSDITGLPYSTLSTRLSHGWSVNEVFERPLKNYPRKAVI